MATNAETGSILNVLPVELHSMKRWLLWKSVPIPGKTKVRKIPHYANGRQRKGLLDTEADLTMLVTFEEAENAYLLGGYSGLGFALTGEGVGAIDLDDILNEEGELIKAHAGYPMVGQAEKLGCYVERSPSGRGLRIVGPCSSWAAYSKNGVEAWSQKRFVTLTGDLWANAQGWVSLDQLMEPLKSRAERSETIDSDDEAIITPETIATLRDALSAMEADERDLWIRMGLALSTMGEKGKLLWFEWSKRSKKFDYDDAERVWESFVPTNTSFRAVLSEARDNWDWIHPKKRKRDQGNEDYEPGPDDMDEDPEESLPNRRVPLSKDLKPTEFILDGFLPVGVSVIAGAWGAGKSTNLIPLLASAAHLAPAHWGFRSTIRRKVIWVTEAPDQAQDTIFSLTQEDGAAPWSEFEQWFHLFSSVRTKPKKLAKDLVKMVEEATYELDNGFLVHPVIVLDTTAANIELENESDNSQVSQAMALLKQALPGVSLVLVGHTPKAVTKADVSDMTFRGAGAWEADAVATYFLVYDDDADLRFLAIRKRRFDPDYHEISFGHEAGSRILNTPWGEAQSKRFMHGVPQRSSAEERRQVQAEARDERQGELRERHLTDRQTRIMEILNRAAAAGRMIGPNDLREEIGGKKELVAQATARLEEGGLVIRAERPADLVEGRGRPGAILLPSNVDPVLFFDLVRGTAAQGDQG